MKKSGVLYQIKMLEKMIGREFIKCTLDKDIVCPPPTPTQMLIMDYIISHENENILQKDLEDILKLRRATVSGVLQTMEKHGLIKRVICESDARIKKIILNDKAANFFKSHNEKLKELENIISCGISKEELICFNKTLVKMQKNIINYIEEK